MAANAPWQSEIVPPTPVVNTSFDVNGVTFAPTAAQFTIGASNRSTLTVRGGGITNNSNSGQIFAVPVTFATNSSITMNFEILNSNGSRANGCGIAIWPCEPAGAINCGTWKW